jgi:hypothetical protein
MAKEVGIPAGFARPHVRRPKCCYKSFNIKGLSHTIRHAKNPRRTISLGDRRTRSFSSHYFSILLLLLSGLKILLS